jgi:hypothetical protein
MRTILLLTLAFLMLHAPGFSAALHGLAWQPDPGRLRHRGAEVAPPHERPSRSRCACSLRQSRGLDGHQERQPALGEGACPGTRLRDLPAALRLSLGLEPLAGLSRANPDSRQTRRAEQRVRAAERWRRRRARGAVPRPLHPKAGILQPRQGC